MFNLHDKVVYPGLGVARVNRIIEKNVSNSKITLYELKFIHKDMVILVPTNNSESIGLRALTSRDQVDTIFDFLAKPARRFKSHELTSSNWNRRCKDYQLKLMSGNLEDVSFIYRELKNLAKYKELSFGEKHMLNQTEVLLVQEIAAVKELAEEKAVSYIRSIFDANFDINRIEKQQQLC